MRYSCLLFILIVEWVQASTFEPAELNQSYSYLNTLRNRAGMTEFIQSPFLETAAFNHANYLTNHNIITHTESSEQAGFTGVSTTDRAIFAGYHSTLLSENLYMGHSNFIQSIDSLMSAIYHRFTFLDFIKNDIGIGIAHLSDQPSAYTYEMGNHDYNALCEQPGVVSGSYYKTVCEPQVNVSATEFDAITTNIQGNNPNIVLWPANNDNDVPPVFYEEVPDPLPDYSVSGYPISLQFNPLIFTHVTVTDFKIYNVKNNSELQNTRILNQETDPQGYFSILEYALFPLERLEWNTQYRVEATYDSDAGTDTLQWQFRTRNLAMPVYTIQGINEVIEIPQNAADFAIYIPPTLNDTNIGAFGYTYNGGMTVNVAILDQNTLKINLLGQAGQQLILNLSGNRSVVVTLNNEVCQQPTLSSDMKLHIPLLHYLTESGEAIKFWADLEFLRDDLIFTVSQYGEQENISDACGYATLSSAEGLQIPMLQYNPSQGVSQIFWAHLDWIEALLFKVTDFGIK